MSHFLRVCWPIVDETRPLDDLIREAAPELLLIAAQAKARITAPGTWRVARSADVPGSGRVTTLVLIHEAPAVGNVRHLPTGTPLTGRRKPRIHDERTAS